MLETFKNCKEVKHIMIMITAIIYFFLSYVIFDQQLKITFRKSSGPHLKKSAPPFLLTPPLKLLKVRVPPFLPTLKIFSGPPCRKGRGEDTVWLCLSGLSYHMASLNVCKYLQYEYQSFCNQLKNQKHIYSIQFFRQGTHIQR